MKKNIFAFLICIFGPISLTAGCGCGDSASWPSLNNFEIDVGYRRDKVTTKVSGTTATQNLVEEYPELILASSAKEDWHNLNIIQVAASASFVSCSNYAVKVSGDYGHIYSGEYAFRDVEKFIDLFSISENGAKGNVYDASAGVGYLLTSTGGRCIVTPYVGYAYRGQNLKKNGSVLDLCFSPPDIECTEGIRIADLNVSYKPRWYGPWAGIDFNVQVETCAYAFASFEWHLINYSATEHVSFGTSLKHQSANGQGYIVTLGGNWEIWRDWSIGLMGHYRNFRVWDGNQKVRVFDLENEFLILKTKLSRAQWVSGDVSFLVAWRF